MHDIIDKRVVYNLNGKLETIVHTAKLPEKNVSGVDGYDFAYDYNYDMTEDDSYYEPKIHNNNHKHDTGKKSHLTLNFSGFSFVAFAISSVLLSAS
jgi:hypothetical protein